MRTRATEPRGAFARSPYLRLLVVARDAEVGQLPDYVREGITEVVLRKRRSG